MVATTLWLLICTLEKEGWSNMVKEPIFKYDSFVWFNILKFSTHLSPHSGWTISNFLINLLSIKGGEQSGIEKIKSSADLLYFETKKRSTVQGVITFRYKWARAVILHLNYKTTHWKLTSVPRYMPWNHSTFNEITWGVSQSRNLTLVLIWNRQKFSYKKAHLLFNSVMYCASIQKP